MAAAKSINAVREEGLEGAVGCFAAGRVIVAGRMKAMFTIGAISSAIMFTTRQPAAGQTRTDMGLKGRPGGILINLTPISTMLPTAFHTNVAAHGIQKDKLELEGIGVVGNFAKKSGAGGILEVESGVAEELKQPWVGLQIRTSDSREFGTNHLLYIDDLELLAKDEDVMQKMTKETEEYLTHIGLTINRDKSATNSSRCADTARLLEGPETYKYLGITETRYSSVSRGMYSRIHEEIKKRVNMLLDTDLSAKNLFRAVNQYALTVPNYYIGVVPMEPYQFARLDRMVRKQLYEKGAHKHCANISRLYLPQPDIVADKRKNRITIVDIGITSQHNMTSASR
ncbi:reverse-transcriptase domain containing protein,putative [Babesia caballi]|uniref:Reverse-transcriptase domain containing protein,putative n=1 Tax=Babesia caballi TaxID=5871 RepID=A0AAV4LXC3_BABCB|nr:reverse-transcriptase domain containing protein,putative [Babesia caballi]